MVAVPTVSSGLSHLFSKDSVESLERLLERYDGELPAYHHKLMAKDVKTFNEKKYLSWLRHSLSFKLKQTSPQKILESWTLDVLELLGGEWVKVFSSTDDVVLAFMGKLGSGELNLSSDIDVIFFGADSLKLKKIRDYIGLISASDSVPSGFVVDLDLRPGGTSAPMICSSKRLGDHLWNSSDPWERYSYTRMDAQLGKGSSIVEVKEIRDKFCYRKYLSSDFFHFFIRMRKDYRVYSSKGEFNVKLGAGGIRDVELFVQTFQILHGGKDVKFRGLSTFDLLDLFIREGINKSIFQNLKNNYSVLRQAEGELHALNETGGFVWKKGDSEFDTLLFESANESNEIINSYIKSSNNIFGNSSDALMPSSFRDRIEEKLENKGLKGLALKNLDQYFLSKKNQFKAYYGAILSQEKVLEAFLDLLQYSDYGCQILSRRPSLLDVFLLRRSDPIHGDEESFLNSLSDMKMVQRLLASSDFKKHRDMDKLGVNVTSSYETILKEIIKPEDGIDLLFFGKMASGEMGLKSDLDFVMVTDNDKASLKKAREIYKKLSYLTVFGPLVPFDTDGGPMGKATPLVVSWKSIEGFLKDKAEPWQKLMYLKQRRLYSNKEMIFLDGEMSKPDIISLFDVLRERLRTSSYKKDPYKQAPGGLFHTEFIVGALFLRLGLQPVGNSKISELLERLDLLMYEKDAFKTLAENYYKVSATREDALINSTEHVLASEELLRESFEVLEQLSVKYLYDMKVEI